MKYWWILFKKTENRKFQSEIKEHNSFTTELFFSISLKIRKLNKDNCTAF